MYTLRLARTIGCRSASSWWAVASLTGTRTPTSWTETSRRCAARPWRGRIASGWIARPDLQLAVKEASRGMAPPDIGDLKRVKRIARYSQRVPAVVLQSGVETSWDKRDQYISGLGLDGCCRNRKNTRGDVIAVGGGWSRRRAQRSAQSQRIVVRPSIDLEGPRRSPRPGRPQEHFGARQHLCGRAAAEVAIMVVQSGVCARHTTFSIACVVLACCDMHVWDQQPHGGCAGIRSLHRPICAICPFCARFCILLLQCFCLSAIL